MRINTEVKKDGRKVYTCRLEIDGTKHRLRAPTKREVETAAAQLKAAARRRRLGLPVEEEQRPDITYGALCELLLDGYLHTEQSKRTLSDNLRYSREHFDKLPLRAIRFEQVRLWLSRLTVGPTTQRNAVAAARQAFNFAIQADYIRSNPFLDVPKPRASERKMPFESWDEVYSVAGHLDDPTQRALVIFACATGLRPQEWQAIEWRDVDLATGSLRINRALRNGTVEDGSAKTPGSLRGVDLTNEALDVLRALPTPLRRDQLVFPGVSGGVLNLRAWARRGTRPGPWTHALELAELEHRGPGQMRHTFATLAIAAGAPAEWISKQMGHADIATTLRQLREVAPRRPSQHRASQR